ncbi:hypothetical protein TVAG_350170 [Trichomonas vaginalis G3]|uniref:Uncharacterized protein n=1 Tax=Trichomonas vaginalis (strain ATCC PRA-98 / G3) TaxID=412133 RepID=A2F3J8_TRIV3|nr:hypothetical protein TVAGG3_0194190 [Trichomonas vaginalis G3]EAY00521.1 hypothetical protein TVAG_350170 [Trichomonas vaginalis G3]KAI5550188.1 hypothetical protein TVAGG3_0194190 [Trichomonas vaginalis G3]|eukprot:XP_001313450.1 hypothetical protein [Trichomonas vaginalis G3]
MKVECGEIYEHISFDPLLIGQSTLILSENTARLLNGRLIQVEGGNIKFEDSQYLCNIVFSEGKSSSIEIPTRLHFSSMNIQSHLLNIKSSENSSLSIDKLIISGSSNVSLDHNLPIIGQNLVLFGRANLNCDKISLNSFSSIETSLDPSSLPTFVTSQLKIFIPVGFEQTGFIRFDKLSYSSLTLCLKHNIVSGETRSSYDKLVNKFIPLISFKDQHKSSILIEISESRDPWEDTTTLFISERVLFDKKWIDDNYGFVILTNPSDTYKTFIYSNSAISSSSETVVNKTNKWYDERNYNKYTKGVMFIVHDNFSDDSIDLQKIKKFGQKISLHITKSNYFGSENHPSVSLNIDNISDVCESLTLESVNIKFLSEIENKVKLKGLQLSNLSHSKAVILSLKAI